MSKPPAAIRYLILLAAFVLLATAVCSKTRNAAPTSTTAKPATTTTTVPKPLSASEQDAGSTDAEPLDAAPEQPLEEPFFPASKSGGMF